MVSPILFAGGEDIDFVYLGSGLSNGPANNIWAVDTTTGHFRSGFARCCLALGITNSGVNNNLWMRTLSNFSANSFWISARLLSINPSPNTGIVDIIRLADAAGIVRLRLRANNNFAPIAPFLVQTVNAAGTAVTVGTSAYGLANYTPSALPANPDKIDIFVNYSAAGQIKTYLNGFLTFDSGTVNLLTDSNTALSFIDFGQSCISGNSNTALACWSEIIVSTNDTRNYNCAFQAPVANGNTHTFDTGAASNVNEIFNSDSTIDSSGTAAQLQEYTVGALPSGTFGVVSVVQVLRTTAGPSGPQNIEAVMRTGGTDYTSSNFNSAAWARFQNNWDVNPNTTVAWLQSDLNAVGLNMGYKSAT